jgi:solute carrier family 30 (zinc transporter), member 2
MVSHKHGMDCSHNNHNCNSNKSKTEQQEAAIQQQNQVIHRLYVASSLCAIFLIVEVVGGWIAGSLAVLSDAAHLFADLASFAVAIAAAHLAALPTTEQHTFGLKRMESLAALFSMVCLAMVSVGLASEAVMRLLTPPDEGVNGKLMSGIAGMGVVVNIILAFVLGEHHVHMPGGEGSHDHEHDHDDHDDHSHNDDHSSHDSHDHHDHHDDHNSHDHHDHHDTDEEGGCHGHDTHENHTHGHTHVDETEALVNEHQNGQTHTPVGYGSVHPIHADEIVPAKKARNINLEAAYIHVLGDLAQSVAVLIAGVIIWLKPEWHIVDPVCTLLFCAMVFYSTLGVLRSSISVLLEEVPPMSIGRTHTIPFHKSMESPMYMIYTFGPSRTVFPL